jgi:hypothetical protein
LREWRANAEQRGFTRIAELSDYLQADELTHVKLGTRWIRLLTEDDPQYRDELVAWSRQAVARIQGFYGDAYGGEEPEPHFTFLRGGDEEYSGTASQIIGE